MATGSAFPIICCRKELPGEEEHEAASLSPSTSRAPGTWILGSFSFLSLPLPYYSFTYWLRHYALDSNRECIQKQSVESHMAKLELSRSLSFPFCWNIGYAFSVGVS